MDLDQLQTFAAVLTAGSFTKAAESLGVSQSTVSAHIKNLETAVGQRLVDRGREGVEATTAGRLMERYAHRMLALRAETLAQLRAQESGLHGRLDLAASTIAAEYLLPPALAALRELQPGVDVSIEVSDSSRAVARLVAGECDAALVGQRPQHRDVDATPFAGDEIVLVGASGSSAPVVDDLRGLSLVRRRPGSGTRGAVDAILRRAEVERLGPTIEVGSTESAKRCVMAGLGVAFVSRLAITQELELGRLVVLPFPGTPLRRSFFVALRRGTSASPATAALLDILLAAPNRSDPSGAGALP